MKKDTFLFFFQLVGWLMVFLIVVDYATG